ncbi:C9 hydroxylase cytochrome P450 [Streptomyces kanamyceticus]|uniref:Cytochrome P450 n=1 Tax=Streptomyces kanamyceticus TaxID=1967 RepID=E9KTB9_STRKN|nr:C9 hydroxylase cytochrome P450 [Streptomyces kanamyceticus]ADU56251.1 cytochrome P450 [Streptomyces kanamyceticus]QEU89904.1 cytochrome P450 [Streptomyces kanamyceticus]
MSPDTHDETTATSRCPFAIQDAHRAILESGTVGSFDLFGIKHWLVAAAEDVKLVTNDPRFSSAAPSEMLPDRRPGWFSGMDLPEHSRYRQKIAGDFTLRAARKQEDFVVEAADSCLDDIEVAGPGTDLIPGYAKRLPSLVINALYGLTLEEGEVLEARMRGITGSVDLDSVKTLTDDFFAHALELVRAKRDEQGDDLLHRLASTSDGEISLSDDEATGVFATLLFAGHDSVQQMVGYSLYALLSHPEQQAALRARPELIDNAVEEMLRFLPVNQMGVPRVCVGDIDLQGVRISAGDNVIPLYSTANRDAAVFPDPDAFDVTRPPEGNFAFGHGIHKCPGQHVARLLIKVACLRLFERFPDIRLTGDVPMNEGLGLFSPAELRVTWGTE